MARMLLAIPVLALVLAAGCTSPTAGPTRPPTLTPVAAVGSSSTPAATATPTASVARTSGPISLSAGVFLEVVTPVDETVVRQALVEVRGRTTPDAVVSVDGQAATVGMEGDFRAVTQLEEGPNAIEVIASDFQGRQQATVVSVIFAP